MYCTECGILIEGEAKTCQRCGHGTGISDPKPYSEHDDLSVSTKPDGPFHYGVIWLWVLGFLGAALLGGYLLRPVSEVQTTLGSLSKNSTGENDLLVHTAILPDVPVEEITTDVQPDAPPVVFDPSVINATLQIVVKRDGEPFVSGTGVYLGAGVVLTNYHVVQEAFENHIEYSVHGCVTNSLQEQGDCRLAMSPYPTLFGDIVGDMKYEPDIDLALLYLTAIHVPEAGWMSWTDALLSAYGVTDVLLSEHLDAEHEIEIGDAVYSIGYPDYANDEAVQTRGSVVAWAEDLSTGVNVSVATYKISSGNSGGPVFSSNGELVGLSVACLLDNQEQCTQALFIPLSSVHAWYTSVTGHEVRTWEGQSGYTAGAIPEDVAGEAMCLLRANAHYDPAISKDSCTCDDGYAKSEQGGDCDVYVGS